MKTIWFVHNGALKEAEVLQQVGNFYCVKQLDTLIPEFVAANDCYESEREGLERIKVRISNLLNNEF